MDITLLQNSNAIRVERRETIWERLCENLLKSMKLYN